MIAAVKRKHSLLILADANPRAMSLHRHDLQIERRIRMKSNKFSGKLMKASLAALTVTACTGITALAATGWVNENGVWYYYESNGDYAYDEWKKSGDYYFYLGGDGEMLTDTLIDDGSNYYYVDENGAMVTNRWVQLDDESAGTETESGYVWYYFGSNGRAYKKSSSSTSIAKRTINGKNYAFDEEGHMLYGWVDADGNLLEDDDDPFTAATYYFGEPNDGAMVTASWLEYDSATDATSNVSGVDYDDYSTLYFYFGSNGKKYAATDDDVVVKSIGGVKYAFDQNGVMLSDWINTLNGIAGSASTASDSDIKYFSDSTDGHLQKKTWIYAVPSEDIDPDDFEDSTYRWFYAGSNGSVYKSDIKTINGKKYAFDENGIMKYGFVITNQDGDVVSSMQWAPSDVEGSDFLSDTGALAEYLNEVDENGNAVYSLYYFSNDETSDGSMKTGKSISIELDNGTYTFGFKSSGKAYGVGGIEESSNKYYQNGILLKASSDYKYGVIEVPDESSDEEGAVKYLVVTTSGSEVTGNHKYVKDADGNYIVIIDGEYYAYVDGADHAPVWDSTKNCYCYYDDDETGNKGDVIAKDESAGDVPSDMCLNF